MLTVHDRPPARCSSLRGAWGWQAGRVHSPQQRGPPTQGAPRLAAHANKHAAAGAAPTPLACQPAASPSSNASSLRTSRAQPACPCGKAARARPCPLRPAVLAPAPFSRAAAAAGRCARQQQARGLWQTPLMALLEVQGQGGGYRRALARATPCGGWIAAHADRRVGSLIGPAPPLLAPPCR